MANFYRYQLGTMLYLAGRHHQAAPVFRRVLELQPGMYPAHVQLARMMEADGDFVGALAEREAAVATFPEDGTLHMELGSCVVARSTGAGSDRRPERGDKGEPKGLPDSADAGRDADGRRPSPGRQGTL